MMPRRASRKRSSACRLCREKGVVYEGFSLLTANRACVRSAAVAGPARRLGKTPEQVVFRFALQVGMVPLSGTTSESHMAQDLEALRDDFELTGDEVRAIERCALPR